MAATATPIDARHAVGGLFDSPTTTPPAPPVVAESEARVHEQHQRRRRRQRGISPSDPPPVPSTPSPPPSSSASSSGTARYPVGSATNGPSSTPQHRHSSSHNDNGRSPLLQSSAEASVKSYGTASDASDDAGTHSGQSAIVAQRSTTSIADGDSPRPLHHDTPLSGTCAPTPTDTSIRVNDVLAGARHADHAHFAAHGTHTVVPASANNYVERGFALHDGDVHNTQQQQSPQPAQPQSAYDPHSHTPSVTAMRHSGGKQSGGGSGTSPAAPAPAAAGQGKASGADAPRGDHPAAALNAPSLHRSGYNEGGAATGGAVPVLPLGAPGPLPSFSELILRRVRTTSLLQFLWVVLLMLMLLVGNACQVIFLNFWIHQFPKKEDKPTCRSTTGSSQSGSGSNGDGPERAEALESSYTTFIISATIFSSFFVVLLAAYWFWRRTNLKFVREWAGWRLLLGIGAMDTLNSGMAIYAAAHTPEVLQALFVSLVPIYSAFFTKWLLKDPRSYGNIYVTISFALIMAGVGLASLFSYVATHQHSADGGTSSSSAAGVQHKPAFLFEFFESDAGSSVARDRRLWCLIFFLSVPPTVLMNVWQTMYMIRYTESDELTTYLAEHEGEAENSILRTSVTSTGEVRTEVVEEGTDEPHRERQAGDLHGQLAAAAAGAAAPHGEAGDGAAASAGAPLLASDGNSPRSSGAGSDDVATSVEHRHRLHVPASALHLHGEDTTVKLVMLAADTTIQALIAFVLMPLDAMPWFGGSDSIQEVWQNLDDGVDCVLHCPRNLRYCLLYSMGFVLVYIAAAYLNRYSVTLCSMVSQLSGPITALVLIAFPSLNMTGDAAPWYVSVFAVVLLSFGTVIYVYWDEMTGEEKARGEMQLKWEMMEEQARRHQPVDDGGDSASGGSGPGHFDSTQQQQQHHRRSRTRRYRRRRQSSYVVIVDHDPDAPQAPVQAAAGDDRRV